MATDVPLDLGYSSSVWDCAKKHLNGSGYYFMLFYDSITKQQYERLEHILIWERLHQKCLPRNCCIHHRDCNRKNNNAENLMCIPSTLHLELHAKLREAKSKFSPLEYEIKRFIITEEYAKKSIEIMGFWELLPDE